MTRARGTDRKEATPQGWNRRGFGVRFRGQVLPFAPPAPDLTTVPCSLAHRLRVKLTSHSNCSAHRVPTMCPAARLHREKR